MKQGSTGHKKQQKIVLLPKDRNWKFEYDSDIVFYAGQCNQLFIERRIGSFGLEKSFFDKIPFQVWRAFISQFIIINAQDTPDHKGIMYLAISPLFEPQSALQKNVPAPMYKPNIDFDNETNTVIMTIEKVKQSKIIKP